MEWTIRDAGLSNPSPLLFNGLQYVLSGRGGELRCFDASTGELVYLGKMENVAACWASPWTDGNKVYFYDERGVTQVI